MLTRSVFTAANGDAKFEYGSFETDHRSPLEERWGGWFVTGKHGTARHLGNAFVTSANNPMSMVTNQTLNVESLVGVETGEYLSPHSDIAALMVFEHQMRMTNLLIRAGWGVRYALHQKTLTTELLDTIAREVVDYMLFVDEAPLKGRVTGTSGFAKQFAERGPKGSKGRGLRNSISKAG